MPKPKHDDPVRHARHEGIRWRWSITCANCARPLRWVREWVDGWIHTGQTACVDPVPVFDPIEP